MTICFQLVLSTGCHTT